MTKNNFGEHGSGGKIGKGKRITPAERQQRRRIYLPEQHRREGDQKDIWVDGKCVGESAPDVYFYTDVKGEFSPNTLELTMDAGTNYYVRQYIKMGVLVGGAGLEQVSEEQGKKDIAPLGLATQGHSSGSK